MKKRFVLILLIAISLKSFAGTGGASDEILFLLSILGFLFLVVLLLYSIDLLQKNGKIMIDTSMAFFKKQFEALRQLLKEIMAARFKSPEGATYQ
jgi:hypothetical protein